MNINFRAQPDPQLNQRGFMTQGQNELPYGKTTYFVCRHTPHPKTVCHIKGLNDAPICFVRDRGYPGHLSRIPGPEQDQRLLHTQAAVDLHGPSNALSSQAHHSSGAKGSQLRDEISEFTKMSGNLPLLKRKDDPLRQYLEDHPESSTSQEIQSPLLAMRYRPAITDNINYTHTFLDQEVKILEKLHDILQTDSLADIKQWLSRASIKEKEFVSNFIRSDVTSRDLLNYRQKPQDEAETENLNLPALWKAPRATHKGTPIEGSLSRTSTQGSTISKRTQRERGRERLREKITIPTSENLPLEHSLSRHKTQERSHLSLASSQASTASSQASTQLLFKKSSSKQRNHTSREHHLPSF